MAFMKVTACSVFLLFVVVLGPEPIEAASIGCPHVSESPSIEDPYSFLDSFIQALRRGETGIQSTSAVDDQFNLLDHLYALKRAANEFSCAQETLLPYERSSQKAISTGAMAAASTFELLAEIQDKKVEEIRAYLDAAAGGLNKPGSFFERIADLANTQNEVWKSLLDAAVAATYSIPAVDPATGLMSHSTLTKSQHQLLLKELKTSFGERVTKGLQAGQPAYLGAAAVLYEVLSDPRRVTK